MSSTPVDDIDIRKPQARDGYDIYQLIANSPPLDLNSIYSYYLLSDHFRDSCVVAESQGKVAGFLSAYRIPQRVDTLFIWQVVVHPALRGQRVASRMLESLLQRFEKYELRSLEATVNPSNIASRALFERLATEQGTHLEETPFLDADAFGANTEHECEILLRVRLKQQNL